jgi:hypothetical protein
MKMVYQYANACPLHLMLWLTSFLTISLNIYDGLFYGVSMNVSLHYIGDLISVFGFLVLGHHYYVWSQSMRLRFKESNRSHY